LAKREERGQKGVANTSSEEKVAIIGAGAWGTTLAWMLGRQGQAVALWVRRPDLAEQIQRERKNHQYRPEVALPQSVTVTAVMSEAVDKAAIVIVAVPSHGFREVIRQASDYLEANTIVVSATKGLERGSGRRMSEILAKELSAVDSYATVALSGPNLSEEISKGMPAVTVSASENHQAAARIQALLGSPAFRVYRNYDIIGVELCGALKNIIAIGAGISDGLGYGDNAKAALITRGLTEMARLGVRLGAAPATFWGIAGVGDVVATCHSRLSRNWQVGWRLARGESLAEIQGSTRSVAEGIYTTIAAKQLSERAAVATPITGAVYKVLFEGTSPAEAVEELMSRPDKAEMEEWRR